VLQVLQVLQPTSPKAPCAAPSSTNAFSVRKCGLPHTSLSSKQTRGLFASRPASATGPAPHRYAPHRSPYPVPGLPNPLLPSPKPPSAAASRPTKRIILAAHVWHCVSALLVSFQHPALRQILSAFLLFCRGTSSVSLRQEPSLVRSCMHASCRL